VIHIVNAENRSQFHHALMDMHRQRKTVFIDEMKWRLEAPEGLEIDAYDSAAAIYLIECDTARAPVTGSARLLETTQPHLMADVFSHLCDDEPPRGRLIWEATRFCPAPGTPNGPARHALLGRIIAGILETALLFGIEQVTFVANVGLATQAMKAGWSTRTLGAPQGRGRERIVAVAADIDAAGLRRVRANHDISGPITRFAPGLARAA
jgi:acyl-homoserine lactone synthase